MTMPIWHQGYKLSVECQNCPVIHGRIWIYMYFNLDNIKAFKFICHLPFNDSSCCSIYRIYDIRYRHIWKNMVVLMCLGVEWVVIDPESSISTFQALPHLLFIEIRISNFGVNSDWNFLKNLNTWFQLSYTNRIRRFF